MSSETILVLASGSPRRIELLRQIGVRVSCVCPPRNEPAHDCLPSLPARRLCMHIAAGKNREVCETLGLITAGTGKAAPIKIPDLQKAGTILVLSADTLASVGRRLLGKPRGEDEAAAFLDLLSGRNHRVTTGLCLSAYQRGAADFVPVLQKKLAVETRLKVKSLSRSEKRAYLQSGEWYGAAGGYAIQGVFAAFVLSMTGSYSNIVGLPLYETARLLTAYKGLVTLRSDRVQHADALPPPSAPLSAR